MNKIYFLLGFVMAFLYLTAGVLLIFTNALSDVLGAYRDAIGWVFLVYGIFRIILGVQKWRRNERQ